MAGMRGCAAAALLLVLLAAQGAAGELIGRSADPADAACRGPVVGCGSVSPLPLPRPCASGGRLMLQDRVSEVLDSLPDSGPIQPTSSSFAPASGAPAPAPATAVASGVSAEEIQEILGNMGVEEWDPTKVEGEMGDILNGVDGEIGNAGEGFELGVATGGGWVVDSNPFDEHPDLASDLAETIAQQTGALGALDSTEQSSDEATWAGAGRLVGAILGRG